MRFFFAFLLFASTIDAQFNPQTYPDPRVDPAACRIVFPGQLCDPSEILSAEQRTQLIEKIQRLQQITASVRNTSPPCLGSQNSNLYLMIALIDKLGTVPFESVSVEKFTNLLRSRYQNFQDVGLCDTMVLIVNSRSDRQVFTVAGRDAKLSREVLQSAFHRNLVHFRSGNYAMGLEGMIEHIVSAYNAAHIMQVPAIRGDSVVQIPSGSVSAAGAFAHGVRQKPELTKIAEKNELESVAEEDKLWIELLSRAMVRCGGDSALINGHVRAIVEEAMGLSLKLIGDSKYNAIEEESQDPNKGREQAWKNAKFIDDLFAKYGAALARRGANQCPDSALFSK